MRKLALRIPFVVGFAINPLHGQTEQYNYNYIGIPTFESGEFTSYQLDIEFFQDQVQERAIADYGGPDKTLYYVQGSYNPHTNVLHFNASYLVWTTPEIPQRDYCVLGFRQSVKNLKSVKAFSGHYTSKQLSGDFCEKGLLILSRVIEPRENSQLEETFIPQETKEETTVTRPISPINPLNPLYALENLF